MTGTELNKRYQTGARASWLGIITNIVLTGLKLAAGILANSQAMVADGMHSASDAIGSIAVLIGLRVAREPADGRHPYGHGRAEDIAAKIVGIILLLTGLRLAGGALLSVYRGDLLVPGQAALWMALVSLAVKESLYQYKIRVGRRINSPAVVANALEHRSDAVTSAAALVGIWGARQGVVWLDPVAGLIVSLFIIRIGWTTTVNAMDSLMDRMESEGFIERVREIALDVPGVEDVHDIRARRFGPQLLVDVHVEVQGTIKVWEGHLIGDRVRDSLKEGLDGVADVTVHLDPCRERRGVLPRGS